MLIKVLLLAFAQTISFAWPTLVLASEESEIAKKAEREYPFDSKEWKLKHSRALMVQDLAKRLNKLHREEVLELLGQPSQTTPLQDKYALVRAKCVEGGLQHLIITYDPSNIVMSVAVSNYDESFKPHDQNLQLEMFVAPAMPKIRL